MITEYDRRPLLKDMLHINTLKPQVEVRDLLNYTNLDVFKESMR